MKICYLGHSCFMLTSRAGTRIVTDPYGGVGFSLPRDLQSDGVTVSHGHYDHCNLKAVGGKPAVFDKAGAYSLGDVKFTAFKSFHDGEGGRRRGENLIFKFCIDGLTVCHLGDLGEPVSEPLLQKISPVDVLLIPVGGVYTIDGASAKEYVDRLSPAVVIPMHYKVKGLNLDIAGVDGFVESFESEGTETVRLNGCEIGLSGSDANQKTKIIVMERLKG